MEEPDLGDLLTSYYHSEILVEEPDLGDLLTSYYHSEILVEEPDLGDLLTSYYHSEILVEEPYVGDLLTRVRLGSMVYTIASVDYNPHITHISYHKWGIFH